MAAAMAWHHGGRKQWRRKPAVMKAWRAQWQRQWRNGISGSSGNMAALIWRKQSAGYRYGVITSGWLSKSAGVSWLNGVAQWRNIS